MTPRERQEAEIKTIKPRGITINLSDADVERLFEKAYSNGLTPSELIEGFLGDLLDGTYSHGSDERDLADEYFERCGYDMGTELTFLRWALEMNYCDDIIDLLDDRDAGLEILADWEKDISSPEPREDMTLEEIKKEMAEDEEVLQSIQEELLSYYNEYAEYMKRRGEEPQPLEDGIEEIRQYHRTLIEMRDSEEDKGCDEDNEDEQPEP